jgi:DNA-binding NarL/FixJ family response regulator
VKITVFLVDDHRVVIDGMQALIDQEPDMRVVGVATAPEKVLPQVVRLQPRVVVLDLVMPQLSGIELLDQLRKKAPQVAVAVLSMHADEPHASEALRRGASAYVPKSAPGGELVRALRAVAAGQRYLAAPLTAERLLQYEARKGSDLDPFDTLTARERTVLRLVAAGLTNQKIGDQLGIAKRTVDTYRENLSRKLDAKTKADLVRIASRHGLGD